MVFYDAPQLILLRTEQGLPAVAAAIDYIPNGIRYLATEIPEKTFKAYRFGRVDLNFLFRFSHERRLYVFDRTYEEEAVLKIKKAPEKITSQDKNYPDRGFFEADHTEDWVNDLFPEERVRYPINGKWDAQDFSKMYGKLGDIYAFLAIVNDLSDRNASPEEIKAITSAINAPTWGGGGSYVGFYLDIAAKAQEVRPLRVAAVQYNSPGFIEVAGQEAVFKEISETVSRFIRNQEDLRTKYGQIHKTLKLEKLLGAHGDRKFSSLDLERYVYDRSVAMCEVIGLTGQDAIFRSVERDVIVFAKIILSYYRRIKSFVEFQFEGRITITRD